MIAETIDQAVLEMKRTAHNIDSLNYSGEKYEVKLKSLTRRMITAWRMKTIRDRTVGIVTRESLEAGSEKYDLDKLTEAREKIERNLALNLDQIDVAVRERKEAIEAMEKLCVHDEGGQYARI